MMQRLLGKNANVEVCVKVGLAGVKIKGVKVCWCQIWIPTTKKHCAPSRLLRFSLAFALYDTSCFFGIICLSAVSLVTLAVRTCQVRGIPRAVHRRCLRAERHPISGHSEESAEGDKSIHQRFPLLCISTPCDHFKHYFFDSFVMSLLFSEAVIPVDSVWHCCQADLVPRYIGRVPSHYSKGNHTQCEVWQMAKRLRHLRSRLQTLASQIDKHVVGRAIHCARKVRRSQSCSDQNDDV